MSHIPAINGLQPMQPVGPMNKAGHVGPASMPESKAFQELLIESLNKVNQLQLETANGIEQIVAGKNNNLSEVFSAVRKADLAFSMLMKMQNQLTEAYGELQQMQG